MAYRIEGRDISKRFPGVLALDAVSLALRPGTVHAIVGENGAGKSTLMNILAGVIPADRGEVWLDGQRVTFTSARAAERAGVVLIHQELSLVPALSVAENVFLGREPTRVGFVDRRRMAADTAALLDRLGHRLDPRRGVDTLKVNDQQIVEIVRALSLDARVLVMDEPTTALATRDVERLFAIIRLLKEEGTTVIYISHKMDELFRIADEFTVLRDGRRTGHLMAADATPAALVRLMVGRDVTYTRATDRAALGAEVLRVERLSSRRTDASGGRRLSGISFSVRAGEVLGVAGLMGAGRTELLEALFGVHPMADDSRISVGGAPLAIDSPRQAIRAGLALVPEDRKAQGLVLDFPVGRNITLARLRRFSRLGFLQRREEAAAVGELIQRLGIRTPDADTPTIALSGGNQQKVVLAKWLLTVPRRAKRGKTDTVAPGEAEPIPPGGDPGGSARSFLRLLLLDEPTKGIDVNGKTDIYRLIEGLAARGLAIVLVSSELPELLALSDRILVLRDGRLAGTLDRAEATEERIIALATITSDATAAVA